MRIEAAMKLINIIRLCFVILVIATFLYRTGDIVWRDTYSRPITSFTLDTDKIIIGLGGSDDNLLILEKDSGKILKKINAHSNDISSVKIDGSKIYTTSLDSIFKTWSKDFDLIKTVDNKARIFAMETDADSIYLTSADTLNIWSKNGTFIKEIPLSSEVYKNQLLVDDKYIYTAEKDTFRIRDKRSYLEIYPTNSYSVDIESLGMDEDNVYLGLSNGVLSIWNKKVNQIINESKISKSAIGAIDVDSKYIYIGAFGSLNIYDKKTLKNIKAFEIESGASVRQIRHDSDNIYAGIMYIDPHTVDISGMFYVFKKPAD